MKIIDQPLSQDEINALNSQYGHYLKLTIDLNREVIIAGCELHADGEKVLLESGGKSEDIWGGGISLTTKTIDTIAVLNIRPSPGNNSMEILDQEKRETFIKIVKEKFACLWE